MKKTRTVLVVLGIAALVGLWGYRLMAPPPVLIDVPEIARTGVIPGGQSTSREEGSLRYTRYFVSGLSDFEVASLATGGPPVIIRGQFSEPISGRARAMKMLGTGDVYGVRSRAPGRVVHSGGPFQEFSLFRKPDKANTFHGFWAATAAGVATINRDLGI